MFTKNTRTDYALALQGVHRAIDAAQHERIDRTELQRSVKELGRAIHEQDETSRLLAHVASTLQTSVLHAQRDSVDPYLSTEDRDLLKKAEVLCLQHARNNEVKQIGKARRAGLLRRVLAGIGLLGATAAAPNSMASPSNDAHTIAVAPAIHATIPSAVVLRGIATFYGNENDGFGYVNPSDPAVAQLLQMNGHDPILIGKQARNGKVIAKDHLTGEQMLSLFKKDPVRYALIRRDGKPYDPRDMVIAMDKQYLGKRVLVKNPRTGASVEVLVGDTGAFSSDSWAAKRGTHIRLADLSAGVAAKVLPEGKGEVEITILS
jgi:hypothetical protein